MTRPPIGARVRMKRDNPWGWTATVIAYHADGIAILVRFGEPDGDGKTGVTDPSECEVLS